ncbi:hypothetical protein QFX18_03570 [Saccharophagus degradans]|uniref:hypothetical protein n=1 Tax=Saccharophagus degradans TaxID=86304 RepID=UPI002477E45F|nr:hypothetical protein [Saccharophagus degradans]WGO99139.1 hypothetical protein QFX18_03570 [Saccharophagus degradans]
MKLFIKSTLLFISLTIATLAKADTLMLQIVVDNDKHSLLKAWITPRSVAPEQNAPSQEFIQIVAYNDVGGQVYEYFMEDRWTMLANLSEQEKIDHLPPESYILKIPQPNDVARVVLNRGSFDPVSQAPKFTSLLTINRTW